MNNGGISSSKLYNKAKGDFEMDNDLQKLDGSGIWCTCGGFDVMR